MTKVDFQPSHFVYAARPSTITTTPPRHNHEQLYKRRHRVTRIIQGNEREPRSRQLTSAGTHGIRTRLSADNVFTLTISLTANISDHEPSASTTARRSTQVIWATTRKLRHFHCSATFIGLGLSIPAITKADLEQLHSRLWMWRRNILGPFPCVASSMSVLPKHQELRRWRGDGAGRCCRFCRLGAWTYTSRRSNSRSSQRHDRSRSITRPLRWT